MASVVFATFLNIKFLSLWERHANSKGMEKMHSIFIGCSTFTWTCLSTDRPKLKQAPMTLVKTGFPRLCHDRSKARSHHSWICQTSRWRCPELIDALWILQSIRKIPGENKFSMWLALWFKKTILRNHLKGELDGTKLRSQRFQFPDMITSMHQVSQQLYIAYIEWLWISAPWKLRMMNCGICSHATVLSLIMHWFIFVFCMKILLLLYSPKCFCKRPQI